MTVEAIPGTPTVGLWGAFLKLAGLGEDWPYWHRRSMRFKGTCCLCLSVAGRCHWVDHPSPLLWKEVCRSKAPRLFQDPGLLCPVIALHQLGQHGLTVTSRQQWSFPCVGLKQNVISLYVQNKDPLMNTAGLCLVLSLRVGGKSVLLHVY